MRYIPKKRYYEWQTWFAWRPVWTGEEYVWLETVERHIEYLCGKTFVSYRTRNI